MSGCDLSATIQIQFNVPRDRDKYHCHTISSVQGNNHCHLLMDLHGKHVTVNRIYHIRVREGRREVNSLHEMDYLKVRICVKHS